MNLRCYNKTDTIAYLGLNWNKGRILVIDADLQRNLIVNETFIVAHTANLEMIREIPQEFYRLQPNMYVNYRKIVAKELPQEENSSLKRKEPITLAQQYQENQKKTRDLIFLQTVEQVIEKALGDDEVILVRLSCVIGFDSTVSFFHEQQNQFISKNTLVKIKGPGKITN